MNSNGAKMRKTCRLVCYFLFQITFSSGFVREREREKMHREKLTWNREILSINATLE